MLFVPPDSQELCLAELHVVTCVHGLHKEAIIFTRDCGL